MTQATAGTIEAVATAMANAAAAALQQATGLPASAVAVALPSAVDPTVFADAFAARAMLTGAVPGGLVTVVPASGIAGGTTAVAANQLIDTMAAGVAAALTEQTGTPLQVAPAEELPADPNVAGMATHIISFDLTVGDAAPITVHWIVEATLDALIATGDPVISEAPVASSAAPAVLPDLGPGAAPGAARDMHLLSEVRMNVTVELGRAVMAVRDLLALRDGSIVELNRPAGAAVDVLVNGTLVARGEVVVIDDELGVRVTELVER